MDTGEPSFCLLTINPEGLGPDRTTHSVAPVRNPTTNYVRVLLRTDTQCQTPSPVPFRPVLLPTPCLPPDLFIASSTPTSCSNAHFFSLSTFLSSNTSLFLLVCNLRPLSYWYLPLFKIQVDGEIRRMGTLTILDNYSSIVKVHYFDLCRHPVSVVKEVDEHDLSDTHPVWLSLSGRTSVDFFNFHRCSCSSSNCILKKCLYVQRTIYTRW